MTKRVENPSMSYQPIAAYPNDAEQLASTELKALRTVWLERRSQLQETGVFQDFLKKMQREWAIETGIIERLYTWDRGVTETLIEHGIDASIIAHQSGMRREQADHVKAIIEDQVEIVEGLFTFVKGEQPLTEHFIRGLQAKFTAHQDTVEAMTPDGDLIQVSLQKGEYKRLPNNPRRDDGSMHYYCPPERVKEEMERLVQWYREREDDLAPEVQAAWLHHRFTQIHPFQDGNGRVARALATLVFLRAHLFPLVIRDTDRTKEYIPALETADAGDLTSLVKLFARRQKEEVLHALGLEQQVRQQGYAEQIFASGLQVLKGKFQGALQKVDVVYEHADALFDLAEKRMGDLANIMSAALQPTTPPNTDMYHAGFDTANADPVKKRYFYRQIVQVARQHGYFANLDRYHAWLRISISTAERFEIVVSIHGYGHGETGILAVSAFTDRRVEKEEGGTEFVDVSAACVDLFQFNYAEPRDSTTGRFKDWLEDTLAIAIGEWNRLVSA
jgi:Fic family protein